MKLIFFFLFTLLISICSNASNNPEISLNSEKAKFVEEIHPKEKSEINHSVIDRQNSDLQFEDLNRNVSVFPSTQQKKVVSGKIVDEKGITVAGVSVVLKGTSIGTISNANGMYSLTVSDEAEILVFSFIGMQTQEVEIGTQSVVDIVLKLVLRDVEEVMVVAYGTTTKESFTGSAKMLNETKIQSVQNPDVTQALQGNVSGVEISQSSGSPGASASVRIRGIGSINASGAPLIVVDGIPFGNTLNTINSLDIKNITVLKDAAATALYGSRAANGAILVTTKSGNKNKPTVEFVAQWGVSTRAIPNYETVNTKEYFELMWEGLFNAYNGNGMADPAALASKNIVGNMIYNPYNILEPVGTDGKIKPEANLLWEDNWADAIYNTGKKQEYGIIFSGGTDNSQYYMSLGYLDMDGILLNSNYKRYSARINNQRKVLSWLNVGMNFSGSTTNSNEPIGETGASSLNYQATAIGPVYPIYMHDSNGNIINDVNGEALYDFGMNGDEDGRAQRPYWANPGVNFLGSEQYDKNSITNDQVSMRTFSEISFSKDLKLKTTLSFDYTFVGNHLFLNPEYGQGAITNGSAKKSDTKQKVWTVSNILNYTKSIDKQSFEVLAGHERYKLNTSLLTASKTNFDFANMQELAAGSVITNANSYEDNYALESFLSRINYDFDNRYYISASYRADGSSRFHKDVRWGNFWSLGTSWRISEEKFMEGTKSWLNNLKAKASYGTVGNDNLGTYYAYQQLYATGHNNLDQTGVQISRLGTPNLTWEVSKTSNFGIEAGFVNRFNVELELFKRKVEDMLFARPLPLSAGITSVDENIGDMQNTGLEFSVFANAVKGNIFSWDIEFNATHYKNKITRLMQDEIIVGKFQYKEGNSVYDFFLKEWAGVDPENGDPLFYTDSKDLDNRGTTSNWFMAPKLYQGTSLPDLFGGLTNTLNFSGIELQVLVNYKIGGTLYDNAYQLITQSGIYNGLNIHKDVLDRWTSDNKNSQIPAMNSFNYHGNITSSRYIMDASYVRLRNLNLGYRLPEKVCEKIKMENCKISLVGENLFTLSHSKGYDPEAGFTNEVNFNYPQLKVISLAVNITL